MWPFDDPIPDYAFLTLSILACLLVIHLIGEDELRQSLQPNSKDYISWVAESRGIPGQRISSRGEEEVGRVLRAIMPGHEFLNKHRPAWLLNDFPGRKTPPELLELDWYCEELKLAVEYNGKQHYEVVSDFYGTDRDAARRKLYGTQCRDVMKVVKCKERGVTLIVVKYDIPLDAIQLYLRQQLVLNGFEW